MPPDDGANGWRSGHDPFVRLLRFATAVVLLILVVYLIVRAEVEIDDLPLIFGVIGVILILVGYQDIIKLPWFSQKEKDDD